MGFDNSKAAVAINLLVQLRQRFRFRIRLAVVWIVLFSLLIAFFLTFDLKFSFILEKLPYLAGFRLTNEGLIQGVTLTLFVCAIATTAAVALGFVSALGRLSSSAILYGVSTFYTSFFRGTPLLLQIFLIYLGLPQLGPVPAAIPSGVIALSLHYGAYLSEIFRAGIASIPSGQREAAAALGLHRGIIMWKIVLPQAMRVIIPPAGAQFIAMLKDSSLLSVIGVWEVMFLAQSYGRASYRYFEMLTAAAAIYWLLSIGLEVILARLEWHYAKNIDRVALKDTRNWV